jgi:hypothetical protein
MKKYDNINEICKAVDDGLDVYCKSANYKVIKKGFEYFIRFSSGFMINLIGENGGLNEEVNSFFSVNR